MKKSIFSLMMGAIVALSSCSKSDETPNLPQSGEQSATFQIEAPAATRATVTGLTRYIVEAYEGKDITTTPVRVEAATGSLTLALKKNTEYTFVFWADKGTANTAIATSGDYYDATTLQDVKVNPTAYAATVATPAYCLAVSFNSKDFETNKAVVLKNATAQLNFTEAAGLVTTDNSLTVRYSSGGKLNVVTGKITEIGTEISRTYANIGKIAKDGVLVSDYILAPLGEKRLLDLKVTFNTEPEKLITALPFQQNYKTSVKGEYSNMYSSTFTVSNEVKDYADMEFPAKAKIGDFYYKDKTFSSTYTEDTANPCIGIVFWVDPANGKKGKIVGLTQSPAKVWGHYGTDESLTVTDIRSTTDGATATKNMINAHSGDANFSTAYSAFHWVYTVVNGGDINERWYIPAKEELKALYGKYTDGTNTNVDNSVKTAVNISLNAASATSLSDDMHWSSTELHGYNVWYVRFSDGYVNATNKNNSNGRVRVRVVSAF